MRSNKAYLTSWPATNKLFPIFLEGLISEPAEVNSRKGAKAQSATAFLKVFFAPWRLCGRRFSSGIGFRF
jgi:hypothetical protein